MPRLANNPAVTLSGFGDPSPEAVNAPSCDPKPESVRLASEVVANPPSVSYAIGMRDLEMPGLWFLSQASSSGNLMRTRDPLSAVRRDAPGLLSLWANDRLDSAARKRLADRNPFIVPVSAVVADSVGSLDLELPEESNPSS